MMVNFKMIEKPFVLLFLLCLLPLGVSAQSIVKGIVTDPSGEPVIGATVKVDGSKLGVVTDLDDLLAELKKRLKISIFLWRKSCASR